MLIISSSLLNQFNKIQHGFFSRLGGVSEGEFFSLNCNTKSVDEVHNINANIALIAKNFMHEDQLKMLKQVHSNKVVVIENASQVCSNIEADAIVTNLPRVLIAVQTADCVPILFCDADNGIIAATHAGWRGTFTGVIENTIKEIKRLGAVNINAAIGPCIRMKNYEVDQDFCHNAISIDNRAKDFFSVGKREKHYQFDLPGYCQMLLNVQGVRIEDLGVDTYSNPQLFFSYRRAFHQTPSNVKVKCGNQVSAIIRY